MQRLILAAFLTALPLALNADQLKIVMPAVAEAAATFPNRRKKGEWS